MQVAPIGAPVRPVNRNVGALFNSALSGVLSTNVRVAWFHWIVEDGWTRLACPPVDVSVPIQVPAKIVPSVATPPATAEIGYVPGVKFVPPVTCSNFPISPLAKFRVALDTC